MSYGWIRYQSSLAIVINVKIKKLNISHHIQQNEAQYSLKLEITSYPEKTQPKSIFIHWYAVMIFGL